MQIPARTPAMTAMTAASLDVLTGGRFRLGLGVSGPTGVRGLARRPVRHPLARTREYMEVVRTALARKTVAFDGEHYQLPLPDGPGKSLKLTIAPVSEHMPIYLAAVGPKNLELAGEVADGWLAVFFAPSYAAEQLGHVLAGRDRAGKTLDGFDVVPTVPLVVGDDPRACADPVRGVRRPLRRRDGQPRRRTSTTRWPSGWVTQMRRRQIQDLYPVRPAAGRDGGGAVRVHRPDLTAGRPARIAEGLQALAASGVTTCCTGARTAARWRRS